MGNVKEEIAKNIRFYRKKASLTQRELAKIIGVNNSAVSNWESGQNSIDIETLFNVCKALGVSIGEIYGSYGCVSDQQYTEHEREVICAYRNNPAMHGAVDKLLGIQDSAPTIEDDISSTISSALQKSPTKK